MKINEEILQALQETALRFDSEEDLLKKPEEEGNHWVVNSAPFALSVFWYCYEPYYDMACRILNRICDLQDTRPGRTFGLWDWDLQQCLDYDSWLFPDYNCADFLGKRLVALCKYRGHLLPDALREKLYTVIRNAAHCTIQRNVGSDYTNIAVMSNLFLISAGELLRDDYIFSVGKERLDKLCRYTDACGGFSEYNSSCYTLVVVYDVALMLGMFEDGECLQMAHKLNYYAWKLLADHFNNHIQQLSPPQARSYTEMDSPSADPAGVAGVVWEGTGGRYGRKPAKIILEHTLFPIQCPEELLPLFEKDTHFLAETYFRPNHIRRPGEDVTIIRDYDNPDLIAYTYRTPVCSVGAFNYGDTWVQRRTCSVIWDREQPKVFRLRGIHDGKDFSSGMSYVQQENGRILGHLGLVTDRGSWHYIVDPNKTGIFDANELCFRFDLIGNVEQLRITQEGNTFLVCDKDIRIRLHIAKWVFDGKEAAVHLSEDGKSVILEGYRGETTELNTQRMGDTYGIFTMEVLDNGQDACTALPETTFTDKDLHTAWQGLEVSSLRIPVPYRRALGLGLEAPIC